MPQIATVRVKDETSGGVIAVVLSQDAITVTPDGQPWSAVSLSAQEARALAGRLVTLAGEIENNSVPQEREKLGGTDARLHKRDETSAAMPDLASILVFHDGSEQSHRAFQLAMDFASRSLSHIQLTGIYGGVGDFEESNLPEDHEWQLGWLKRLTQTYSSEAAKDGIGLKTTLVEASDRKGMMELLSNSKFDLIILPYGFSENKAEGATANALMRSITRTSRSRILLCP